jgi:hypothetical protein
MGVVRIAVIVLIAGAFAFFVRQMATDQRNRAGAIRAIEATRGGPADHGQASRQPAPSFVRPRP